MKDHMKKQPWRGASRKSVVAVHLVLCTPFGWAAPTDILNSPPFIASAVKPNILFLMDDSDSMKRHYLPDYATFWIPKTASGGVAETDKAFWPPDDPAKPLSIMYGHYSLQCNYMAYNPEVVYAPPLNVDGTQMPNASIADFSNPKYKPFYFVYGPPGTNPPMNFTYLLPEDKPDQSYKPKGFYTECISPVGNAPGAGVFRQVFITSSDDTWTKQNFQNWLKYYGDRRSMMKTAVKQAFSRLGAGYRVGFGVTSYEDATDRSSGPGEYQRWKFVNVNDFGIEQKQIFFTAVDKSDGYYDTPLRGALAKAGQYFANKARGQSKDPMQLSCQRNIAILATDGGWTKEGESPTAKFGAYGLSSVRGGGAELGQQDSGSSIKNPFRDSGNDKVVSLADVSYYYYNTDLRDESLGNCEGAKNAKGQSPNVCKNDVKGVEGTPYESFGDMAKHQHMTTYTLGLGLSGQIPYDKDYRTKTSGAFHDIVTGAKRWTTLEDPGSKNDYLPRSHTDDLWHAAVNGRGQYFSANDPATVVQSLSTALSMVKATAGAASAAATTSNQPVTGDNDVFVSSFVSQKWIGDVESFVIDPETGVVGDSRKWSAKHVLDELSDVSKRRIFYRKPGTSELRNFTAANLASDGLATHFTGFCASKKGADGGFAPTQCINLTPAQQDNANSPEQLVNYLRGVQGQSYYRTRESRMGDVVNAGLVYVGKPNFPYKDDASYLAFKSKARPGIVLAGANDGMLHAFSQKDGSEKWAFVPTAVMRNMYKLADTSYPDNHVYFVDATPQLGDVKGADGWRTIVVGGLNAGGRSYYALDVTDTEDPKVLWEFSHRQLGLSFGNPIITKRTNGQWVVVFASGYNNGTTTVPDEPSGNGNGHLFVLDALTGNLVIDPIQTLAAGAPVGKENEPSGLAKINVWVEEDRDNTMLRAYGGDLLGNVWRFDIDGKVQPHQQALRLAQLRDSGGKEQSVTTKPALAQIKSNGVPYAMVYVGTGRYLGISDLLEETTAQRQSVYAIKDPLTNTSHGNPRGSMVQHTVTGSAETRTIVSGGEVDLSSKLGWWMDLPGDGERVNIDPSIALDSLYVAGNIPEGLTCKAGGSSFVYKFALKSGAGIARYQGDVLVQGLSLVQITSGNRKGSVSTISRRSDGTNDNFDDLFTGPPRQLKRSAWRALAH